MDEPKVHPRGQRDSFDSPEDATREEEEQSINRVREVYEKAVAQVPPGSEKRFWRRYIFLWLDYALFEEIETKVFKLNVALVIRTLSFCRTTNGLDRYTRRPSNSFPTNYLPSPNCGSCSPSSRYGDWTCQLPGRYLVRVLGCALRKRCSRDTSNWNSTYEFPFSRIHSGR